MTSRLDGDYASVIFGIASGIRQNVGNKTEYVPHLANCIYEQHSLQVSVYT